MSTLDRPWPRPKDATRGMKFAQSIRAKLETHWAALLASVLTAVLMTWPLAAQAGHHVLKAIFYWDAYTNAMIMGGHVDALLGRGPLSLYDNYFFAPIPNSIVFNENLYALSWIFAPLYVLSGNPLWAYNVTLLTSLALSVFFTYLLVRRLTGDAFAGLLAGIAFAFCPYVMFEIGRIQLVATQWIPASFWLLHRAVEGRRRRDIIGFGLVYLLQVGTCLYYAMFLVPLLAAALVALCLQTRPPRRFFIELGVVGLVVGALTLAIMWPYFAVRHNFLLERSLEFASTYDGKLSYFLRVHPTNRTLNALHHSPNTRIALEDVAFPGATVLVMSAVGVVAPLVAGVRAWGARALAFRVGALLLALLCASGVSWLTSSLLPGVLLVLGYLLWGGGRATERWLLGRQALYLWLLGLGVVLFLGLVPWRNDGKPILGLYYYFYQYLPGFDGMRKVSRQAVMTSFLLAVLSGHGVAWLLNRGKRVRLQISSLMVVGLLYELRAYPHPLQSTWAGDDVPEVYRHLRGVPEAELVAAMPQNEGVHMFRGDAGLTLHNYLMLYHKHRSLNGQSSWQPPVTDLVDRALKHLPSPASRRVLQSVGLRHLVIHAADLPPQSRALPARLAKQPEFYRQEFESGGDFVFELLKASDGPLELESTAQLPHGARLVPRAQLAAFASVDGARAKLALDGDLRSSWTTRREQARGDYFEIALDQARPIVALELDGHRNGTHLPLSFEVSALDASGTWHVAFSQPEVRVPRDLVFSPRTYVLRAVLPEPIEATRVRVMVLEPHPGWPFSVHEARLYER